MKKYLSFLVVGLLGFLGLAANASASFMGDIATEIGSGATDEVGTVIGGPIGSIIFYVLAIFLIGFVVTTITMWIRGRK